MKRQPRTVGGNCCRALFSVRRGEKQPSEPWSVLLPCKVFQVSEAERGRDACFKLHTKAVWSKPMPDAKQDTREALHSAVAGGG